MTRRVHVSALALACLRRLGFLLVVALRLSVPAPLAAQPAPAAPGDLDAALEQSRALLKDGDYDHALEVLRAAIVQARHRNDRLREAYLLMIKTYVLMGNARRFEVQGREASLLAYKEAKARVLWCLSLRELRHTQPEPRSEYPDEMVRMFAESRAEIFGAFRVVALAPPGASVLLDGDTLRTHADGTLGDIDLAVGPHNVLIQHQGYETRIDAITIAPASTLERDYRLARNRSGLWYASVGAAGVGVVAGIAAAVRGNARGSDADPFGTASTVMGPSIRASAMGRAGGAVFWGEDVDDWANPALLGVARGIRYSWGSSRLFSQYEPPLRITTQRVELGAGGIGIGLPGAANDHGSALLDYGTVTQTTPSAGQDESVLSWAVGLGLPQMVESLGRLVGRHANPLDHTFDAGIGINHKRVRASRTAEPEHEASATDYGFFSRATLVDNFDRHRAGLPIQIDLSYGLAVLNGFGTAQPFGENRLDPVVRTWRNSFAVRLTSGTPEAGTARSWLVAESLTPLVSIGAAADFEHLERFERGIRVQRYGLEITLGNLLSLRVGNVQDRFLGLHATTFGVGLGYRYKNAAGLQYDWAALPVLGQIYNTRRNGVVAFIDPMALARNHR